MRFQGLRFSARLRVRKSNSAVRACRRDRRAVWREGEIVNSGFVPRNFQHLFESIRIEDLNPRFSGAERKPRAVGRARSNPESHFSQLIKTPTQPYAPHSRALLSTP